jgi:hypothetical protein
LPVLSGIIVRQHRIAASGHADVVDAHVAIPAEDAGAVVIMADRADIAAVGRGLDDFIV